MFFECQRIREDLAWMMCVAECVDDGNLRPALQLRECVVMEDSADERISPAFEVSAVIRDCFALPDG